MNKQIGILTGLFTVIGIAVGAYMHLDTRYAHSAELEQLQQRVLMNELNQSYRDTRKEVYDLRSLVRKYPTDEDLKQQLQEAEDELKRLKGLMKKDNGTARSGSR